MSGTAELPPQEVAALTVVIKELFATSFIGFTISTTLYGITVLQTYLYYKSYPKDSRWLKLFVFLLWVFDTMTTILVAHAIYFFIVLNFGNLIGDTIIPWSFTTESQFVDIITIMVQCYFALQLYKLSSTYFKIIPVFIVVLAITAFGLNLRVNVEIFVKSAIGALPGNIIVVLGTVSKGMASGCDILIAGGLIYALRSWRSGVRSRTAVIIDNLILYAITRCILTAICQIMFLSLSVAMPEHRYWLPFHQAVGKLYVNSALASLNFRPTNATPGKAAVPIGRLGDPDTNSTGLQFTSRSYATNLPPSTMVNTVPTKFVPTMVTSDTELDKMKGTAV